MTSGPETALPVLVLGEDGTARPGDEAARELVGAARGRYRVVGDTGVLLLRREGLPRVQMAGEIIHPMTIMEVINVIATSQWRGDLHVTGSEHTRLLGFDQGALRYARSSFPDDRLGEVLYRNGILDRAQVDSLIAESGPHKRFGELCVERGLLTPGELYTQLQKQAEEIFYAALLISEGSFAFTLPDEDEIPETTLHVPIQGLLMEGVQRIDEMALFRDKIPNNDLCPKPIPDAPEPTKLDKTAQTVLALCTGEQSITDISRITGLGDFQTTKAVYHLLQSKPVELHRPRRIDPEATVALVSRFNEVLTDIFMAVATYGGLSKARETLDAWIQGSGYGPYFGDGVDEFGNIDAHYVAMTLQGVDTEHPLEALHQALHELAAFALFSATTTLPRDQELQLARDVNTRLKAIRL